MTGPSAQVEGSEVLSELAFVGGAERSDVASREIGDVNKVSNSRSIFCLPVGTKHLQLCILAGHNFDDDREKVCWCLSWVLPEKTRRITSDGVEIAERNDRPLWI